MRWRAPPDEVIHEVIGEMVVLCGGEHQVPQREKVTSIEATLLVQATETSQDLYYTVMGQTPAGKLECTHAQIGGAFPVHCLDTRDAVLFANRLSELAGIQKAYVLSDKTITWERDSPGYRLPTKTEWKAFRARYLPHPLVLGLSPCRFANLSGSGTNCASQHSGLAPVDSRKFRGVSNILGNVEEMIWPNDQDAFSTSPNGVHRLVYIGGSFGSTSIEDADSWGTLDEQEGPLLSTIGIRLVRTGPEYCRPR